MKRIWRKLFPSAAASDSGQQTAELIKDQLRSMKVPDESLDAGVTLIGHPYEVLGRAEDIRTVACALDQVNIPFSLVSVYGDYGKENAARHKDFTFFDRVETKARHKANLFYLNADEMHAAANTLGSQIFTGPYNIGCYAWELSTFPDAWTDTLSLLHEIWVATRFIQEGIAAKTELPVTIMPFAIEPGPPPAYVRQQFGIPNDKFVFLFFFDFRSAIHRKNPWAVLKAFFKAFSPKQQDVHLVIKMTGANFKPDDFQAFLADPFIADSRVQVIEQVMDDKEIKALVSLCDCFVSLHRSEGFGRGLAEAMYYGKPVIATDYSGNVDFMDSATACMVNYSLVPVGEGEYPHGEGQHWAEADTDHAAWYMNKLVDEPSHAKQIGTMAAQYIRQHHSNEAVGRQCKKRLQEIGVLDGES